MNSKEIITGLGEHVDAVYRDDQFAKYSKKKGQTYLSLDLTIKWGKGETHSTVKFLYMNPFQLSFFHDH